MLSNCFSSFPKQLTGRPIYHIYRVCFLNSGPTSGLPSILPLIMRRKYNDIVFFRSVYMGDVMFMFMLSLMIWGFFCDSGCSPHNSNDGTASPLLSLSTFNIFQNYICLSIRPKYGSHIAPKCVVITS